LCGNAVESDCLVSYLRDFDKVNCLDDNWNMDFIIPILFLISVDDQPPEVTISGSPDAVVEDTVSSVLSGAGFSISATDSDGTINAVTVTSANQSQLTDANIIVNDTDPANVIVTITPEANAFGSVDLNVQATDDVSNVSQVETVTVTLTAVNDAPTAIYGDEVDIEANSEVNDFDSGTATLTINNDTTFVTIQDILMLNGATVLGPLEDDGSQSIVSASVTVTDNTDGVINLAALPGIDILGSSPNQTSVLNMLLTSTAVTGGATMSITVTDDAGGTDTSSSITLNLVVVD